MRKGRTARSLLFIKIFAIFTGQLGNVGWKNIHLELEKVKFIKRKLSSS